MKKIFLVFALAAGGAFSVRAQSVAPATINAAGGTAVLGSNEFEWSIGEMTLVSTFSGSAIVVTQGVLQPKENITLNTRSEELSKQLKVFPNPASSVVNIQYTSIRTGNLAYQLFDMNGKLIKTNIVQINQGTTTAQIDLTGLACAGYVLEILTNPTGNESTEKTTFNIQKIK